MLCFLMLPRPPTSPLFPYTTLFRSLGRQVVAGIGDRRSIFVDVFERANVDAIGHAAARPEDSWIAGDISHLNVGSRVVPGVDEDRKSTRLNSSHGYISYAVFCLKKK